MLRTPCGGPLCSRFLYMGFRPLKEVKVINTSGGNESSIPLDVRLLHNTPPEGLRSCTCTWFFHPVQCLALEYSVQCSRLHPEEQLDGVLPTCLA